MGEDGGRGDRGVGDVGIKGGVLVDRSLRCVNAREYSFWAGQNDVVERDGEKGDFSWGGFMDDGWTCEVYAGRGVELNGKCALEKESSVAK